VALWLTDCLWDRFFSEYFSFPQSFAFHQCSVHVSHSSSTNAVILAVDRIFKYRMHTFVKFSVKLVIIIAESYKDTFPHFHNSGCLDSCSGGCDTV
jgi:hypothetical protein